MALQQIQFDLSGVKGLANRFYGDKNLTASQPNLRYLGGDGQLAEGIYNPITTLGYLSPANNTTKVVTGTTPYLLSSAIIVQQRILDASTDAIFFSDESISGVDGKIVNLDTAIDTSLDATYTIPSFLNPTETFYTTLSASKPYFYVGGYINPSGSAFPTLITSTSGSGSSGSTTLTNTFVVSNVTNRVLFVVAFNFTANSPASATYGAANMTSVYSGSAGSISFNIFRLINPNVGSDTITVTWAGAEENRGLHAFLFDGVNQTTPIAGANNSAETNSIAQLLITKTTEYQIPFATLLSEYALHTDSKTQTSIIKRAISGATPFGYSSTSYFSHPIFYFKNEDFIQYEIYGIPKIFFTKSNTSTYGYDGVGISSLDFTTVNPIWSTNNSDTAINAGTNPIGASPDIFTSSGRTTFCLSDNGFLYVMNGNRVHKIDGGITGGTNGTITPKILLFLGDDDIDSTLNNISVIQDAIDMRGKMYLGLHVNASTSTIMTGKTIPNFVGVYVWNRSSVVASMQDFVEIMGVKELKSLHKFQGQPSCFTISTDGYTQFRVYNGSEFKVVKTLGQNAYPVYRRHSVHENGDNIMWLGNDGKIYCYGKIEEGLENALYILGDMSLNVTAGQTYSGSGVFVAANAVETVTSGNQTAPLAFYLSYTDTAGNHLRKWYPYSTDTVATIAQTGHIGNVYTLVKYLPDMSTIKYVDIRCAPTGTGTTEIATIKYYFNGSSTSSFSKVITKNEASRGYIRHEINKPYCNAIQMEIEYSTTNTLGASNDFRPSLAVVSYEDSNTKG